VIASVTICRCLRNFGMGHGRNGVVNSQGNQNLGTFIDLLDSGTSGRVDFLIFGFVKPDKFAVLILVLN